MRNDRTPVMKGIIITVILLSFFSCEGVKTGSISDKGETKKIDHRALAELHDAIKKNNTTVFNQLIKDRSLINAPDEHGITSLGQAILFGRATMVFTLLESGADVNVRSDSGETPLHYAVSRNAFFEYNRPEIAEAILAKGADVNARSREGATPLHYAVWSERLTHKLIEKGADVNAATTSGYTVLQNARNSLDRNENAVQLLLKAGAH